MLDKERVFKSPMFKLKPDEQRMEVRTAGIALYGREIIARFRKLRARIIRIP